MSSEWQTVLLGDVAELSGGYAFKSEEYTESGHFVLRTVNITDDGRIDRRGATFVSLEAARKYERFALKPFDTLFVMVGATLGKTGFVKTQDLPALLNQNMWLIRAKPSLISPLYLHYAFKVFSQPLLGMASGSARGFVKRDDFRQMIIPLPSAPEQVRISSLLGALDDRITLLRETNATLEAIAQALFKSWFVDFDPVRAKQEGRAPEGMSDATAALFPDALEETELGPVPKGWRYSTIGESFILTMGQSPPGDTYNEAGDGLPFYQGRTDFGFRFPSQRVFCTAPTRLAEPGDTLVSVRAPVGDVNMALEKCCVGRGVAAVRHPNGCRSFAFYATRGLRSRFDLFDSEGTVFGSINKKDFQALPVIEPSGDVLVAFDEIAAPIDRRIVGNEEQIRTLATLRDTLLPRLISGQLRVPEATLA